MTNRRFIIMMVGRNEADRYLRESLAWARFHLGAEAFFVDDASSDRTVYAALDMRAEVVQAQGHASFMRHEGQFRQWAWDQMEATMKPNTGDIIIALDADEFIYSYVDDMWSTLKPGTAWEVPIYEVFERAEHDSEGNVLRPNMIRVDGYWGEITGTRIYSYAGNEGPFADKKMGCGSLPTGIPSSKTNLMEIVHFGYADKYDREEKYKRYRDQPGHSKSHIESILKKPTLVPWNPSALS